MSIPILRGHQKAHVAFDEVGRISYPSPSIVQFNMSTTVSWVSSHRSNIVAAAIQLLAVAVCSAVLFLFVALTFSQITLPEYTSNYAQKDTQQVVNLLITIIATVIGILLSHCRRQVAVNSDSFAVTRALTNDG